MGYNIKVAVDMFIPRDNVAGCLEAINDLHYNNKSYCWVRSIDGYTDIVDALRNWRYSATVRPNGDVTVDYFLGEKLGSDDVLYAAIAPFVKDGSTVYVTGEDDAHWKHVFTDGKCTQYSGRVIYDE